MRVVINAKNPLIRSSELLPGNVFKYHGCFFAVLNDKAVKPNDSTEMFVMGIVDKNLYRHDKALMVEYVENLEFEIKS